MSGQSTNPRRPVSIMSNRDRTSTDPERSLLTTAASDPELDTRKERGSKTPRRVQWSDGLHSLDEHGFDKTALQTLTGALERHQSLAVQPSPSLSPLPPSVPKPSLVHNLPPQKAELHPLETGNAGNLAFYQKESAALTPGTLSPPGDMDAPIEHHPISKDVPGHYIDPNERAGLPGGDAYAEEQAADIVRAHTKYGRSVFGSVRRRNRRSRSADPISENDRRHRDSTFAETDRLRGDLEADADIPFPGTRGGLLSALLSLYNADQVGTASGASTPGSVATSAGGVGDLWSRSSPAVGNSTGYSTPEVNVSPRAKSPAPSPVNPLASLFGQRPPTERNGAGVIGSLIASTGNIAGPAAPKSTQLGPNLKRPGYHLSRYSMEEKPLKSSMKASAKSLDERGNEFPLEPVSRPQSEVVSTTPSFFDQAFHASPSISRDTNANIAVPPPASFHTRHSSAASSSATLAPSYRSKWSGVIKDIPTPSFKNFQSSVRSGRSTPTATPHTTPSHERGEWLTGDEKERQAEKERKRKRKKAEIYITRHVAEIIQRQQFICKLARAMMMFGGPSHRLQSQVQATARVLEIDLACVYLPDVMIISFDDVATGTSQVKFIRQSSSLDLYKLTDAYLLYWKVIHDEKSVADASNDLDELMKKPQIYNLWQLCIIGGFCSAAICSCGFNGSFIDALAAFPMGALLVWIQLMGSRNELYSYVFEITVAMLFSFIAAALASTRIFCYSAIASSSIVLILPGYFVTCGALEIMSRNIISGSVRMMYAVVYCLFLGFGLAMGGQAYVKFTGKYIFATTDYTCSSTHDSDIWYRATPSLWWAFLTVPMFSTALSLRNFCSWRRKELILLVFISSAGWVTNKFTSMQFVNQSDMSAACGAFAVGLIANLWARFFGGNAFVIMITGILFQLPSGLGSGGLLGFVSETSTGSSSTVTYLSGFQTALQLVSVAIGLSVGLGISLFLVHPIQSRKRQGGVFSL